MKLGVASSRLDALGKAAVALMAAITVGWMLFG